jgi:hypothetical protein
MFPAKHLSISVNCTTEEVYEFASNAENLPKWAAGLSNNTITKVGDEWETDSPIGKVRVRFVHKNNFGVMDHDIIFPSGEINHNPFRVLKNDMGSEVVFTLYRLPRMSDNDYQRDIDFIQSDLKKLKLILEK